MTKQELIAIIEQSGWFDNDAPDTYWRYDYTYIIFDDTIEQHWTDEDGRKDYTNISYDDFLMNMAFPFLR